MSKLIVKSARESFRRGGITFNREGVVVDPADVTEAQFDAIKSEPGLFVSAYIPAADMSPEQIEALGSQAGVTVVKDEAGNVTGAAGAAHLDATKKASGKKAEK